MVTFASKYRSSWALIDIFNRGDLSTWGKTAGSCSLIVLPFLGVLCQLIVFSAGIGGRRA